MKKFLTLFLVFLLSLSVLTSCNEGEDTPPDVDGNVTMTARIEAMGEKIEVMVTESEYTWGTHLVITSDKTQYVGKNGERITRDKLAVGQNIEIVYSGQVMLSYPPQITAQKITIKK